MDGGDSHPRPTLALTCFFSLYLFCHDRGETKQFYSQQTSTFVHQGGNNQNAQCMAAKQNRVTIPLSGTPWKQQQQQVRRHRW